MAKLREDEIATLKASEYECIGCEHLIEFHESGDSGYGAHCSVLKCKCNGKVLVADPYNREVQLRDPVAREKRRKAMEKNDAKWRREADKRDKVLRAKQAADQAKRNAELQAQFERRAKFQAAMIAANCLRDENTKRPRVDPRHVQQMLEATLKTDARR